MSKENTGTHSLPFGKILAELIAERGLTLKKVGELAGVRPSVIQNWIEGKNPHDLRAVSKLAQALGVSFKALLLGERDSPESTILLSEIFSETKVMEGICRVSITRLTPKAELNERN